MSELTRYTMDSKGLPMIDPEGEYVRFDELEQPSPKPETDGDAQGESDNTMKRLADCIQCAIAMCDDGRALGYLHEAKSIAALLASQGQSAGEEA